MPIVAIACFAAAAAIFAFLVVTATRQAIPYEVAEVPVEAAEGDAGEAEGACPIDWGALSDSVVAWVRVPGTTVDYPIVQGEAADPDYYLAHDMHGNRSAWGTPYIDAGCAEGVLSPLVVVYGHHMSDGTMFGPLGQYSDGTFAEAHRTILVYTRERDVELEVFAVDVVDADREGVRTEFEDAAALQEYLDRRLASCEVVLKRPEGVEQAWAFATCSYQTANSRTVVLAKEVM